MEDGVTGCRSRPVRTLVEPELRPDGAIVTVLDQVITEHTVQVSRLIWEKKRSIPHFWDFEMSAYEAIFPLNQQTVFMFQLIRYARACSEYQGPVVQS